MPLHVGCPIWSFRGWVGNFYPEHTKPPDYLREYSRRLNAVEGNTTFYAVPADKTVAQWREATPASFRFCFKIPKAISHSGPITDRIDAAHEFVRVMAPLGQRLGPMFLQLPPRYSPHMLDDLRAFVEAWPRAVRLGVEVRHPGWFDPPINDVLNRLLADHNMARVVIDTRPIRALDGDKILQGSVYQALLTARKRKPDLPVMPERTADFFFIRYIGHPQLVLNSPWLDEWSVFLAAQLQQGADAFVICHSPENLTAPLLARELYARVAKKIDLPPLPWATVASNEFEQTRLV